MKITLLTGLLVFCLGGWASLLHAEPAKPEITYDDHGRRDPFLRLVDSRGMIVNYDKDLSITDLILEGIMAGEQGDNVAIINSRIVRQNDKIGQFQVIEITANSVLLAGKEQRFTLKLKRGD